MNIVPLKYKRDYTQYLFKDMKLCKSRLVLKVLEQFTLDNPTATLETLKAKFQNTTVHEIVVSCDNLRPNKIRRYFTNKKEIISLKDTKAFVSNQWGIGNINVFIKRAMELGYQIQVYKKETTPTT